MHECFLLILGFLLSFSEGLRLTVGDCPVHFEEPCDSKAIRFVFNARRINPYHPVLLKKAHSKSASFKILVHGYGGLSIDYAIKNVTAAYRAAGYNTIVVDWSHLAALPCYVAAFLNTWHVGQCVAVLAAGLVYQGVKPDAIHVIGFSLGAHIAGFAGNHFERLLGIPIRRITGLDPALPFFATLNDQWKLDPSDAEFVDVIHTGAGYFGKIEAAGHVDFYVNGGYIQPACKESAYPPICSHVMSGAYFAESITSTSFLGVECVNEVLFYFGYCQMSPESTAIMGEHVDFRSRGIFAVETGNKPPYALGFSYLGFFSKKV